MEYETLGQVTGHGFMLAPAAREKNHSDRTGWPELITDRQPLILERIRESGNQVDSVGFKDARPDTKAVVDWNAINLDFNLGIAALTGKESGFALLFKTSGRSGRDD